MSNSSSGTGIGGGNMARKDAGIGGSRASIPGGESNPLEGLYQSALKTQAGDYDSIMSQYKALGQEGDIPFNPIAPSRINVDPTGDFTGAMGRYSTMAQTGGYSGTDIANLRARGISPIRSIYSNAMMQLNRQKALQGGYSPNFTAAAAKMSRDLSSTIADKTTDVNAQIAQMVAEGKRFGAAGHAQLAGQQQAMLADIAARNAAEESSTNRFNTLTPIELSKYGDEKQLSSIQGQQSLYGTTPALANTFGNQVLSALGLIQNAQASGASTPSVTGGKGFKAAAGVTPDPSQYGIGPTNPEIYSSMPVPSRPRPVLNNNRVGDFRVQYGY